MAEQSKLLKQVIELNKKEEFEKVVELLTKDALEDAKNEMLYAEAAQASWRINNYDNCKLFAENALELDINNAKANHYLANVYSYFKEYKKAEDYYLKAIVLDKEYSHAHNGLGNLYKNLKEYKKAENYYLKAIEIDEKFEGPYYNLGILYFYNIIDYKKSKAYFIKYAELEQNQNDIFYKFAIAKLEELEKLLDNTSFKNISSIVEHIKKLLLFEGENITHYTSITTVQFLVLKNSPLRISEGSFLNDTSEGKELFDFLDFNANVSQKNKAISFSERPFIGSFVEDSKCDDLTLWRMYGKEDLEEAKGCSITINLEAFKKEIANRINTNGQNISQSNTIEFYKVAYRNADTFEYADATTRQKNSLTKLMRQLKKEIEVFNAKADKQDSEQDILGLLNEIAYLFKSVEYQYEKEIRLVISETIGFKVKVGENKDDSDFSTTTDPPKVFLELAVINSFLKAVTIGPKVEKAEEWASTFHYHLLNKGYASNIQISTLPFK